MTIRSFVGNLFDPSSAGYDVRKYGGVPRRIPYVFYIGMSALLFVFTVVVIALYTPCSETERLRDLKQVSTLDRCRMVELNSLQQIMSYVWNDKEFDYPSFELYLAFPFPNPGIVGVFQSENCLIDCRAEGTTCQLILQRMGRFPAMLPMCSVHTFAYKQCVGNNVTFNPDVKQIFIEAQLGGAPGSVVLQMYVRLDVNSIFDTDTVCGPMCDNLDTLVSHIVEITYPVGDSTNQDFTAEVLDTTLGDGSVRFDPMHMPIEWPSMATCTTQTCDSKITQTIYFVSLFGGVLTVLRMLIRVTNRGNEVETDGDGGRDGDKDRDRDRDDEDDPDEQRANPYPSSSLSTENSSSSEHRTRSTRQRSRGPNLIRQISSKVQRSFDAHSAGYDLRQFQKHPSSLLYRIYLILSILLPLMAIGTLLFYSNSHLDVSFQPWEEDCRMLSLSKLQHQMQVGWQTFYSSPFIHVEGFPLPELNGTVWRTRYDNRIKMEFICNAAHQRDGYCYLKYFKPQVDIQIDFSCPVHTSAYRQCVGDTVVYNASISATLADLTVSPRDLNTIDIGFNMQFNVTHLFESDKVCGEALCDWESGHWFEKAVLYRVSGERALSQEHTLKDDGHLLSQVLYLFNKGRVFVVGWPLLGECERVHTTNKIELLPIYVGLVGGVLTILQVLVKNLSQQQDNRASEDSYALMMN